MSGSISDAFKKAGFAPPADASAPDAERTAELDPELRRRLEAGPIGGDLVAVTKHAVERFRQRTSPDLGEG